MDQGEVVDRVVFLDFVKAFNKVPHERLPLKMKLANIGVGGNLLKLILNIGCNCHCVIVHRVCISDIASTGT